MAAKKQPVLRRKDPQRQRRAPHEVGRFGIKDPNPALDYRWVNMNDMACGVPKYLADGWETCRYEEGGVTPVIGFTAKPGEEITNSGMVLMCRSKEESERAFLEGEDGESGQYLADAFVERMFERDGPNVDRFRGVNRNRIGEFQVAQVGRSEKLERESLV